MELQGNGAFLTFLQLFTQARNGVLENGAFWEYFHTTSKMRMLHKIIFYVFAREKTLCCKKHENTNSGNVAFSQEFYTCSFVQKLGF